MRILHTSDWHLGRTLHQEDLSHAQASALAQLVALTKEQSVDLVIVAGDIFDRAVPPVEAVTLFVKTLKDLAEQCAVVVTSGNHDSAIRLGYGAELFRAGVHIATSTESVGDGIDVNVDGVTARVYPIPFLVPDHARHVLKVNDEPLERSHQAVLGAATARIRNDIASLPSQPDATIAVAHAFVTGARGSDSERDISVGGVDDVDAAVFEGLDYVALGHLHGPQEVRGPAGTTIRYSGSPLRYSFSEADHQKSVTLFDVTSRDASGQSVSNIRTVEINQPRPMAVLTGALAHVISDENEATYAESWLQVTVTDDARPPDLVQRIRSTYPFALSILHRPTNTLTALSARAEALAVMSPVEVAADFVNAVANRKPTADETSLIQRVYESARIQVEA